MSNYNEILCNTLAGFHRQSLAADYSRSRNSQHKKIEKQDDVTRYNSSNNNVAFYQNYPNRSGTPIKSPYARKPQSYRKVVPVKTKLVREVLKQTSNGERVSQELYQLALKANLRSAASTPNISSHPGGREGYVLNDYHKRETNAGFARNDTGGLYTR